MIPTHENRGTEEEIRWLDNEICEAMLRSDVVALDRLCLEEFVVRSPLKNIVTKQQLLDAVQAGRFKYTAFERQIQYLHIFGETAVVMGNETVVDGGQTVHRCYTEVWMLQDRRWQLVVRHANNITQA